MLFFFSFFCLYAFTAPIYHMHMAFHRVNEVAIPPAAVTVKLIYPAANPSLL